jgi:4-hydroxybenzoate polyprenyltransferase
LGTPFSAPTVLALFRALRPGHWVKNLPCFAGLIFSGRLFWPDMQAAAALAFAAFSLLASAGYLANDIVDRKRDRANPRTAGRSIAAGALPVWLAVLAVAMLGTASVALTTYLGRHCLVILGLYAGLTTAYSVRLKRTVIVDVMCVALGFVLRVLFGVYAVHVLPSPWIVLCMFFLALLMGFGKRKAEHAGLGDDAQEFRPVLQKYSRGYLELMIGVTATLTILTYTLYTVAPHHSPSLIVTVFPVVYCVLRYAYKVMVEGWGESPGDVFLADPMLWLGALTWLALSVLVLYGDIRLVAEVWPQ